ncbi:MAG: TIGR00730 family Rossman fold protein [Terriglobia bacterium]
MIKNICVYCASSRQSDPVYFEAARQLGQTLARHSITIIYGGGALGSMGQLAAGALAEGGKVIGVLPRFMNDLEWGHQGLTELRLVDTLHQRKKAMLEESDAVVALPGGSGTLEELFEAITWKRLGLFVKPIVMVNVKGFFDPCLELLETCIREKFMDVRHRDMWNVVEQPQEVIASIRQAIPWDSEARGFALV